MKKTFKYPALLLGLSNKPSQRHYSRSFLQNPFIINVTSAAEEYLEAFTDKEVFLQHDGICITELHQGKPESEDKLIFPRNIDLATS